MDAHNSNDKNSAFVSYYNYVKQLDILRLYFPKEHLLETYNFELISLRKSWDLDSDYSKLPIESPTRKLFMDMIYPASKGNIDRNNYINDYAQELKNISYPFDTLETAQCKEISYKEIARNLSANQYYLNLLIEVIGNYLKLEWEVAKNFEPIKENL